MGTILAIDPGNMESGYVLVEHDGKEIRKVLDVGKIPNEKLGEKMAMEFPLVSNFAIEMVQSMGQTVGQEVFDTCVWIGRFLEIALFAGVGIMDRQKVYRKEEKLYLCGQLSAKDKNIRQALIDRYGVVGTKKNPGFFYVNGTKFAKDMWAAMAVAVTYFDKYIRGIQL